ncbi:MAG: TM2 domain-containing protein [Solobacterium sp.]|nr:TM2 domain-containing protein [Solobacterium sp.]
MKLIKMTCPSCGANLELQTDNAVAFCQYCGAKLMLDDESVNVNITNRFVDEAQIKALDLEKQRFETEQEKYKDYLEKENEWKKILYMWLGASAATFFFYTLFQNVPIISTIMQALGGVVLFFGGIGVLIIKPKKDAPARAAGSQSYERRPADHVTAHIYYRSAPTKSRFTAFILCLFLGVFGAHYFYVNRMKMGIVYLLTVGLFGFGWMYDILMIALGKFCDDQGRYLR